MNDLIDNMVENDFYKAQTKAFLSRIAHVFKPSEEELLPFEEARRLLKPGSEVYAGMATVPLEKIVGSEGRYRDFNRHFLPKKEHLKQRWVSIDKTRYQNISLPPVRLYEMGGLYFVRDGNHRISVAKTFGQKDIDAEVTSLRSKIQLDQDMSIEELKKAVVLYEKKDFYGKTAYLEVIGQDDLDFTEPGRYDTVLEHINVHKYYLNERKKEEIDFSTALLSWHENVFAPVVLAIREERLLQLFTGRTAADLYLYLVQHWDELKHKHHRDIGIGFAARDFKSKTGREAPSLKDIFKALVKKALGR